MTSSGWFSFKFVKNHPGLTCANPTRSTVGTNPFKVGHLGWDGQVTTRWRRTLVPRMKTCLTVGALAHKFSQPSSVMLAGPQRDINHVSKDTDGFKRVKYRTNKQTNKQMVACLNLFLCHFYFWWPHVNLLWVEIQPGRRLMWNLGWCFDEGKSPSIKDKPAENKQTGSCLHLMDTHVYTILLHHIFSALTGSNKF